MKTSSAMRRVAQFILLSATLLLASQNASSQTPAPAWGFAQYFKYNIENILVNTTTVTGTWNIKVIFSITDPTTGLAWDIHNALPYQSPGAALTLDIGWDPSTDFTNTGSVNPLLNPVGTTALGTGAAVPIQIRNLNRPLSASGGSTRCSSTADCPVADPTNNRFWAQASMTPVQFKQAVAAGRVAIEGRPVWELREKWIYIGGATTSTLV